MSANERSRALGFVSNDKLRGYGMIRRCREGWKIGPLFADSANIAERLFMSLSAQAVGEPIWLDIPEINDDAVALAAKHEMTEVFGCARMYYGSPPVMPWHRIFGATTFELG
jgi:hypothetical protein